MNNPDNLKYTKEHEWILLEQKQLRSVSLTTLKAN